MEDTSKTHKAKHIGSQNTRPTIGVCINPLDYAVPLLQWSGTVGAAREHEVNLICFPGNALNTPEGFQAQANVLYDLVDAERIDGLVVFAEALGPYVGPEKMESFMRGFHPLPVVSVEMSFQGIPGVMMDNYQAMRELMVHLIEVHEYRRPIFIRGPAHHFGLQERYRAYTETLAEYGLPVDPMLVTSPTTMKYLGNGRFQHAGAHEDLIVYRNKEKICEGIDTPGT